MDSHLVAVIAGARMTFRPCSPEFEWVVDVSADDFVFDRRFLIRQSSRCRRHQGEGIKFDVHLIHELISIFVYPGFEQYSKLMIFRPIVAPHGESRN